MDTQSPVSAHVHGSDYALDEQISGQERTQNLAELKYKILCLEAQVEGQQTPRRWRCYAPCDEAVLGDTCDCGRLYEDRKICHRCKNQIYFDISREDVPNEVLESRTWTQGQLGNELCSRTALKDGVGAHFAQTLLLLRRKQEPQRLEIQYIPASHVPKKISTRRK